MSDMVLNNGAHVPVDHERAFRKEDAMHPDFKTHSTFSPGIKLASAVRSFFAKWFFWLGAAWNLVKIEGQGKTYFVGKDSLKYFLERHKPEMKMHTDFLHATKEVLYEGFLRYASMKHTNPAPKPVPAASKTHNSILHGAALEASVKHLLAAIPDFLPDLHSFLHNKENPDLQRWEKVATEPMLRLLALYQQHPEMETKEWTPTTSKQAAQLLFGKLDDEASVRKAFRQLFLRLNPDKLAQFNQNEKEQLYHLYTMIQNIAQGLQK